MLVCVPVPLFATLAVFSTLLYTRKDFSRIFLIKTMNVNIEFSDGITLPLILFKVSELPGKA